MINNFRVRTWTTVFLGAALGATAIAQTTVSVDPRATYLRQNGENTTFSTVPVALSSLGASPGNLLQIRQIGVANTGTGTTRAMCGLFSSSSTILGNSNTNRVPGAIAAGTPYISGNTFFGNIPTDIPQDFLISDWSLDPSTPRSVVVTVPTGATHIFFGIPDTLFQDNSVNTAPFGVTVRTVNPKSFSGFVNLEDYDLEFGENVKFDIVIDGAVVETRTIQLGVNGQFIFFSPFSGPLQVRVKGSKWISALSGVINAGPGSVTGINLLCPGGDVDDDNEVSILDYIVLSTAYGSEQGQPSYRAAADLDGDGMITILDYLILSKNYGRMGA
jgi:hypothetical protein